MSKISVLTEVIDILDKASSKLLDAREAYCYQSSQWQYLDMESEDIDGAIQCVKMLLAKVEDEILMPNDTPPSLEEG